MTNAQERWKAAMAPNYSVPPLTLARGQGSRSWDSEGKSYLDLLAGIAVNIVGHAHPAIVAAVSQQVATLAHTSNLYAHEPGLKLASRLQEKSGGHQVIFQNSGTEANEAALKLVRRHAHAQGMPDAVVLAFNNSFHGRTTGALALTGQPHYQERFGPLPGQILHIPFNDPAALESAFAQHRVAGAFFESVQGEGGVLPMTKETAATLGRLAARHNAITVADEIQAGMGRTGKFFGFEHDGLHPDVVTLAKGLGGGLPLGAALIDPKRAVLLGPGSHGTTFGGNPVCCAAGNAVLDVIDRERLVERAGRLGAMFAKRLAEAGASSRGRGLLVGVPISGPHAPAVVERLRNNGILVGQAGAAVVRIAPALNIPEQELLGAIPAIIDAVHGAKVAPAAAH